MIEKHEFEQGLVPLAEVFAPLSDEAASIYFEHLKHESLVDFKRAVNWLIENHTYKRFPFVAEFMDAIEEVQRLTRGSKKDEDRSLPEPTCACEKCNGTGWHLVDLNDGYSPVARYCTCALGRRMYAGHKRYFEKLGRPVKPPQEEPGAAPAQDAVERGKFIEKNRDRLFGEHTREESER